MAIAIAGTGVNWSLTTAELERLRVVVVSVIGPEINWSVIKTKECRF